MAVNEQTPNSGMQKDAGKAPFNKPLTSTDDKKVNAGNRSESNVPDEIAPEQRPDHPTQEEGDVVPTFANRKSDTNSTWQDKQQDKH